MKNFIFLIISLWIISCSSGTTAGESEVIRPRPAEWHGAWKANWETLPESYPGIDDMEFTMDGNFIFTPDSLTVRANGFDGCIFGADTLSHTQSWYVQNDTLFLISDSNIAGMTYRLKSMSEDKIELQLMEDIFVTLTR